MLKLKEIRDGLATLQEQDELIANTFKARIGDHAGLHGDGWKITWKKNKDSQVIDWKAAFDTLAEGVDPSQVGHIIDLNTKTKPGARVFRPFFPKGD